MPEYLAPGVYVEEVDTGNKPIEGVSTSTAGMVGVAERGPVDVPILVTSFGEYRRWFGDFLNLADFSNDQGRHCYLPHAVQGFFENGGKRVYVVRVIDTAGAAPSSTIAFDRGSATSAATVLLRSAAELSGVAANPPLLVVLDGAALAPADWIRIGDGSRADYQQVDAAPVPEDTLVPIHLPFARSHDATTGVLEFDPADAANTVGAALTTTAAIAQRARTITIDGLTADITGPNGIVAGVLLEIGAGAAREYRYVRAAPRNVRVVSGTNSQATVELDSPLAMAYPAGGAVRHLDDTPVVINPAAVTLDTPAGAGDVLLFVDARGGGFNTATHAVMTLEADPSQREVRRIGTLAQLDLGTAVYEAYPAGSLVEQVAVIEDVRTLTAVVGQVLTLSSVAGLSPGQTIVIEPGTAAEERSVIRLVDEAAIAVTVVAALGAHVLPAPVEPAPKLLAADAAAGATFVALRDRMGLSEGSVVRLGGPLDGEIVTIADIPNRAPGGAAPDAGNVRLQPAPAGAYPAGTLVTLLEAPTVGALSPTVTVLVPRPVRPRCSSPMGSGTRPATWRGSRRLPDPSSITG